VLSPFGGSEGDTASAEAGEAPASADVTGGAPAEDKALEESRTEEEADPLPPIEPLTEQEALKLLQNYLIDMGLSLDIEPGDLSPDESFWSFTARSKDTGERYLSTGMFD
ncbi:MAG: hypothetical protein IJB15_07990, partial [Clostridia bacterium]|nr:hypothetical protein [Clostridia bacterium]